MMMTSKRKNKAGAPNKEKSIKKKPDGLTNAQHDWLTKEAKGRNVTVAEVKREAIEWYITALEKQRDTGEEIIEKKKE